MSRLVMDDDGSRSACGSHRPRSGGEARADGARSQAAWRPPEAADCHAAVSVRPVEYPPPAAGPRRRPGSTGRCRHRAHGTSAADCRRRFAHRSSQSGSTAADVLLRVVPVTGQPPYRHSVTVVAHEQLLAADNLPLQMPRLMYFRQLSSWRPHTITNPALPTRNPRGRKKPNRNPAGSKKQLRSE